MPRNFEPWLLILWYRDDNIATTICYMGVFWQESKINQLYRGIIMKNGRMVNLRGLKKGPINEGNSLQNRVEPTIKLLWNSTKN